jgi:hypothetical protein
MFGWGINLLTKTLAFFISPFRVFRQAPLAGMVECCGIGPGTRRRSYRQTRVGQRVTIAV